MHAYDFYIAAHEKECLILQCNINTNANIGIQKLPTKSKIDF